MTELDSFTLQEPLAPSDDAPKSAWQELSSAFVHETRMQLKGLAQTVGAGDAIKATPEIDKPDGIIAQHAQTFGRAAADAIPIILTGLLVRSGFGRIFKKSSEPGLLLQRSTLGLSTAETATTGFVTGAFLHPTDAQNTNSLSEFLVDRTKSGVSSSLSFVSINAFTHGINSSVSASESTFARVLKNPAASGLLSGIPAGILNPQIDSLVHSGTLNTDFSNTTKSVYESALIGAAFGGLVSIKNFGATRSARNNTFDTTTEAGSKPADNEHAATSTQTLIDEPKLEVDSMVWPGGHTEDENKSSLGSIVIKTLEDHSLLLVEFAANDNGFLAESNRPFGFVDEFAKDEKTYAPSLNALKEIFGQDSLEAKTLEQPQYNTSVKQIADFIIENPDKRKALVSEILLANKVPEVDALRGFEKLDSRLGTESSLYKFFEKTPETHRMLHDLSDYIDSDPETRINKLSSLLKSDAHWAEFNPDLLIAEEVLKNHFSSTDDVEQKLQLAKDEWTKQLPKDIKSETNAHNSEPYVMGLSYGSDAYVNALASIAKYIKTNPEKNTPVVERAIRDDVPIIWVDGSYLRARAKIESVYGDNSEIAKKLFKLKENPLDLMAVAEALTQRPELASLVTRLIEEDCTAAELKPSQLVSRAYLEKTFGERSDTVAKLVALAKAPDESKPDPFNDVTNETLENAAVFVAGTAHFGLIEYDASNELRGLSDHVWSYGEDDRQTTRDTRSEAHTEFRELREFSNNEHEQTDRLNTETTPYNRETDNSEIGKSEIHSAHIHSVETATVDAPATDSIYTKLNIGELWDSPNFSSRSGQIRDLRTSDDQSYPFIHSEDLESTQKRAALLKRIIEEGAPKTELEKETLKSRLILEHKLGINSQAMRSIAQMVNQKEVTFSAMAELFMPQSNAFRRRAYSPLEPAFLERMLNATSEGRSYRRETIEGIRKFTEAYKGQSIDLPKIIKLSSAGVDLAEIAGYLDGTSSNDNPHAITIAGAQTYLQNLQASSTHTAQIGERLDEPAMDANAQQTASVAANQVRQRLVEYLVETGAPCKKFAFSRLTALEALNARFKANPSTMKSLLEVEDNGHSPGTYSAGYYSWFQAQLLSDVNDFIAKDPVNHGNFVIEKLKHENRIENFDSGKLNASYKVETSFANEPAYLLKIHEAEKLGANLSEIASFLEVHNIMKGVKADTGEIPTGQTLHAALIADSPAKTLLKSLLDKNISSDKLTFTYLNSRLRLNEFLGEDSPTLLRVLELEKNGLDIVALKEFIDESHSEGIQTIERLVQGGASAKDLSYSRLRGLSILTSRLEPDPDTLSHLLALEKQGLKLDRLADYVTEDLNVRVPQIKVLLQNRASIRELNIDRLADAAVLAKMTTYFTEPAALKYLSHLQLEGLSANRLLRYIEESPESRKSTILKLVADKADVHRFNKQMSLALFPDDVADKILDTSAREKSHIGDLVGALKNWKTGEAFYQATTKWVNQGNSASIEALMELNKQITSGKLEVSGDHDESASSDRRTPSERGLEIAGILKSAVEGIDKTIPKDRPIVLLGRDNWQLLPLLREQGRPVQYFLWSRLQGADIKTKQQWLKEVPPNAAVVDTGYSGSIINWIRNIDPSADGFLLSSSGRYPQLLSNSKAQEVEKIEYFPKLVGRARTYTDKGGAISNSKDRDSDEEESKKDLNHRWLVQGANIDMLRAAKLSEWKIWRYSEYVGLTPRERLGFDTDTEVANHFSSVQAARQNLHTNAL